MIRKSNHLPFVWNPFAEIGYAAVLNEDRPDIFMFGEYVSNSYEMKRMFGYYYLVFWQAIQNDFTNRKLHVCDTYCFRNVWNVDMFLGIAKRRSIVSKNCLKFMLNIFNYYTHDIQDGIVIENGDLIYRKYFEEMFKGGFLNRSVIILMGDHGRRSGPIRKTLVGLSEERNPLLDIWFSG